MVQCKCTHFTGYYLLSQYLMLMFNSFFYVFELDLITYLQCSILVHVMGLIFYTSVEFSVRKFWMRLDSFKKSEKSYKTLFYDLKQPTYIIDYNMRILEKNKSGSQLMLDSNANSQTISALLQDQDILLFQKKLELCNSTNQEQVLKVKIIKNVDEEDEIEEIVRKQEEEEQKLKEEEDNRNLQQPMQKRFSLEFTKSQSNLQNQFKTMNVKIVNFKWNKKNSYIVVMIDESKTNNFLMFDNFYMTLLLDQIKQNVLHIETDYQKWHNLVSLFCIKQNDLEKLSDCIFQMNMLQNMVSGLQVVNQNFTNLYTCEKTNVNIQDLILHALEIAVVSYGNSLSLITLKFEQSFPDVVYGQTQNLDLIFSNLFFLVGLQDKEYKIEMKVNCFLQEIIEQIFTLRFVLEFQASQDLQKIFTDVNNIMQKKGKFDLSEDENLSQKVKLIHLGITLDLIKQSKGTFEININSETNSIKIEFFLHLNANAGMEDYMTDDIRQNSQSQNGMTKLQNRKQQQNLNAFLKLNLSFQKIKISNFSYEWKPKSKSEIIKPILSSQIDNKMENQNLNAGIHKSIQEKMKKTLQSKPLILSQSNLTPLGKQKENSLRDFPLVSPAAAARKSFFQMSNGQIEENQSNQDPKSIQSRSQKRIHKGSGGGGKQQKREHKRNNSHAFSSQKEIKIQQQNNFTWYKKHKSNTNLSYQIDNSIMNQSSLKPNIQKQFKNNLNQYKDLIETEMQKLIVSMLESKNAVTEDLNLDFVLKPKKSFNQVNQSTSNDFRTDSISESENIPPVTEIQFPAIAQICRNQLYNSSPQRSLNNIRSQRKSVMEGFNSRQSFQFHGENYYIVYGDLLTSQVNNSRQKQNRRHWKKDQKLKLQYQMFNKIDCIYALMQSADSINHLMQAKEQVQDQPFIPKDLKIEQKPETAKKEFFNKLLQGIQYKYILIDLTYDTQNMQFVKYIRQLEEEYDLPKMFLIGVQTQQQHLQSANQIKSQTEYSEKNKADYGLNEIIKADIQGDHLKKIASKLRNLRS